MASPLAPVPPTTTTRQIATRILGGCLLMLVLAGGAGWYWWSRHGRELIERAGRDMREGMALGRTTTAPGCVDQVLDRHHHAPWSLEGTLQQSIVFSGCLQTASGLPALCAQNPNPGIVASATWLNSICTAHDLRDPNCSTVLRPLLDACRRRGAADHPG